MRRCPPRAAATALAAACVLGAPAASAGGTSDIEGLLDEPVLSTASKVPEARAAAPATSTTITAEDLRRYGIRSLDEAINFLALGVVTENPLHSVEIGARGVLVNADFGNHMLLLVNGHAMNELWNGTAYFERGAGIPFELIDHIEVIVGPGSVLYGASAMLGVINVITKRAKDFGGVRLIVESELPISIRGAAGAGYEFTLFGRRGEVTAAAEYYAQKGPSFAFARQRYGLDGTTGQPKRFSPDGPATGVWGGTASRSYFTQVPTAYVRAVYGDFEINARATLYRRGTPYPNFNQAFGDFDDPDTNELDRWVSLDLRHRASIGSIATLATRVYGDVYDYHQNIVSSAAEDCEDGQTKGCRQIGVGASRWAGAELQATFDWLGSGRLVTLIGVDGRLRLVQGSSQVVDRITGRGGAGADGYQRAERSLAVYLQEIYRPFTWLTFNAGARLDSDERFGSRISPRATAVIEPWKGAALKLIYAEAFRAPSAYESFFTDRLTQIVPVGLRAEVVRSAEISFEQRLGAHRLFIDGFRSGWRDLVLSEQLSPNEVAAAVASGELQASSGTVYQYRNSGSLVSYGFDAAFEGSYAGRLRYGVNATAALARRELPDGTKEALPVAAQVFGNARIAYDFLGPYPQFALAAHAKGPRPADRAFDGGFTPTPYAPPALDLRATVTGNVPFVKGLRYRASANVAFAPKSPYVAGAVQAATPQEPSAALAPVDRYRAAIGLEYVFADRAR